MGLRAIFLRDVDRFLKRTGQTRAQLGTNAVGDREFIADVAKGEPVQFGRIERVEAYLAAELARLASHRRRSR